MNVTPEFSECHSELVSGSISYRSLIKLICSALSIDADFYIEESGEVIQVAYSVSNISSDRETRPLAEAAKTLKEAKRFIIITYEEEKELTVDGVQIEVIPV